MCAKTRLGLSAYPNANGYEASSDIWSGMALLLGHPDLAVANAAKGALDYWYISNKIAQGNGPKLAQFILDFKNKCKNTDVMLLNQPLGLIGAPRVPVPTNYQGINVKNELKAFCDADGDGSCDFPFNVRPKFGITGAEYTMDY
jgi:methyl coenzyme M reductase alpha subunit